MFGEKMSFSKIKLLNNLIFLLFIIYLFSCSSSEIDWVWVEGGVFKMGDTFGGGLSNEKPVHTVYVNGFI